MQEAIQAQLLKANITKSLNLGSVPSSSVYKVKCARRGFFLLKKVGSF